MKKIFIIHGWTYGTGAWDACLAALRKENIEPVVLKVPGLTEVSDKAWTLDGYVAWLADILKEEQNVAVVGHSNGGRIALAYAAKNPGKISKLILIDSAGVRHNELLLRLKRRTFGGMAKVGKRLVPSPYFRKVFYRAIGAKDYGQASKNMRETMKDLISHDLTPILPSVTAKTLILWGKQDNATPVSDAYIMNKAIKGSKLVVIADAGHSPQKTHPDQIAAEIAAWV